MSRISGFKHIINRIKTARNACCCHHRRKHSWAPDGENGNSFSMYSPEQQYQIIETLRKCTLTNATRPHLSEKRLQSLKCLFEQNPNIEHLEPLLTVNGIGLKLLHRICDSILHSETVQEPLLSEDSAKDLRFPPNLITPSRILQNNVQSVVSIHLGFNAISWSRLWTEGPSNNKVDSWDVVDLSDFMEKKYDVHSIWDLVKQFRHKVPDGDIYVMENNNWSNVANIKKPMKYHIQEAMFTTAICSIFNQTGSQGVSKEEANNQLYFLRTFTPSRLFNKIVGSECVSAQDLVLNIMEGVPDPRHRPIAFTDDTINKYLALNGSLRDNMCRALLLAISFAELILHHNPAALSVIGKLNTAKRRTIPTSEGRHVSSLAAGH